MIVLHSLVPFFLVQLLAVLSPGQAFVIVSKLALTSGREPAFAAAVAVGLGSVIWALVALIGFEFIMEKAAWAFYLFKFLGGLYLIYLATSLWRKAPDRIERSAENRLADGARGGFLLAFFTQMANPKAITFYGSVLFSFMPPDPSVTLYAIALVIVFMNETLWFSFVTVALSSQRSHAVYSRIKTKLDRTLALMLGGVGAKISFDAIWDHPDVL